MNHVDHHLLCASSRFWCLCFRHLTSLYWSFLCLKRGFSFGSYTLGLSGFGDTTGSAAASDDVLRVTGNNEPLCRDNMGIHRRGSQSYREITAVCCQIHTKHINTLCGQNVELYIKTQSVPHSKHSVSVIKTSLLMLYREIIAVSSQIHTKHKYTVWAECRIVEC